MTAALNESDPPAYKAELPALARLLGVTLAVSVLRAFGSVRGAGLASDSELRALGVSDAKLRNFRNAVAVGALAVAAPVLGRLILDPSDVAAYFAAQLALVDVEEFWLVGLDSRHRIVGQTMVSRGSVSGVEITARSVFRTLLRMDASAAIVVHQHPSGDPTASASDLVVTKKLTAAGKVVGITLLDHLVVVPGGAWRSCKP